MSIERKTGYEHGNKKLEVQLWICWKEKNRGKKYCLKDHDLPIDK